MYNEAHFPLLRFLLQRDGDPMENNACVDGYSLSKIAVCENYIFYDIKTENIFSTSHFSN